MLKPSQIQTYPQFVEAMQDPQFNCNLHFAMKILVDLIESDPTYLTGDDERISKFFVKYHNEKNLIVN